MKLSTSVVYSGKYITFTNPATYTLGYDFVSTESLKSLRYDVMSPRDPFSMVCYFRNVEEKEIINMINVRS